jgi:hypothetical protein
LSCWESCNINNLDNDIKIIKNIDPCFDAILDTKNELLFKENTSRQIVSTLNGLMEVETQYVAKVRSDMLFDSNKFISFYNKFSIKNTSKIFDSPILISSINTVNPFSFVHHVHQYSDWFFFAKTSDLLKLFNSSKKFVGNISGRIDVKENWQEQLFPFTNYSAEQRIFNKLIEDYYGNYKFDDSYHKFHTIHFISNEIIIGNPLQIGFIIEKYKYLIKLDLRSFKNIKSYIGFQLNVISHSDWKFFRSLNNNEINIISGLYFMIKTLLSNYLMKKRKS